MNADMRNDDQIERCLMPVLVNVPPDIPAYRHYYEDVFNCTNCMKRNVRWIRKGTRLKGLRTECDKCGCTVTHP